MEIWLKFCKSKYMANVNMGKFLKMLPITVCQYKAKYSTYGLVLGLGLGLGLRDRLIDWETGADSDNDTDTDSETETETETATETRSP